MAVSTDQAMAVLGALLKGGCTLFGKPIEINWPEGLPYGWTKDDVLDISRTWSDGLTPNTINWLVDPSQICLKLSGCGRVKIEGKCDVHG